MTSYEHFISLMDWSSLNKVKITFWGKTYGVDPQVIQECVDKRCAELLRDRPEAQGD